VTYSIAPNRIQYVETRRGIQAHAPIMFDGVQVGTLEDYPELFVTPVTLTGDHGPRFLACAREAGFNQAEDSYALSEYARCLLKLAEDKLLEKPQQR
jgi:hypothetical protein